MNVSEKGGEMMKENNVILECQKKFLFNCRYEPTEWSKGEDVPMYICNKGRVNIYCDISNNVCIDDVLEVHKKMADEMANVCQRCKYYNQ